MADLAFEDPRLAGVYDWLDADRSDLEVYADLVGELGASSSLDVGCGTGTFACLLAGRGIEVTAVDPAAASLEVARGKQSADRVAWVLGDVSALPVLQVDLATMTGNVAQVFVDDEEWASTLRGVRDALRPGGHLVFESRNPLDRAWLRWNRWDSRVVITVPGVGTVEHWTEVTEVRPGIVSFRATFVFGSDGAVMTSDSSLRFRSVDETAASLARVGLDLTEIREAPDRPGREQVFIAQRPACS